MDHADAFLPEQSLTLPNTLIHQNPIYRSPRVVSYHDGTFANLKVAVCRYADGTIVLTDGKICIVQRTEHDQERHTVKSAPTKRGLSFHFQNICQTICRNVLARKVAWLEFAAAPNLVPISDPHVQT
jgi:hypothetical protein